MLMLLLVGSATDAATDTASVDSARTDALSLQPDAHRGKIIFAHNCSGCHETHAFGDPFKAVPALAGQGYEYLVKQIANFATEERRSGPMHWALGRTRMRESQSWVDVAAYLSALPPMRVASGNGNPNMKLGAHIFQEQCAMCHGVDAKGAVQGAVPSLRNQHYTYLFDRMRHLAGDDAHERNQGLLAFLRMLDESQMAAVANYLAHWSETKKSIDQ